MKNKRVAVYCQVSTLQEMQDTSFEIQRDAYIQMIASRDGLVLADVYGDHGKSGTSIKRRPEFQRMIHDCEGGKIDIVMTKSISRFARNLRDCLTTIDHLKQLGIPIFFEKEPKGKYVVGNRDEPYTYSMLTKAWRRIRKTTGIRDLHPHMFRYSHATRLHELGVDDKSIQHWEGHASQDTTTKIYVKQTNDRTERAGKILSNFALEADPCAHLVPFLGEDENAENVLYKNATEYVNPMRV